MSAQQWALCADELPDSDTTVLAFWPDADDPVDLAYHDGECWRSAANCLKFRVEPTHWRDLPEGPPK